MNIKFDFKLKRVACVFLSLLFASWYAVDQLVLTNLPSVQVLPLLMKPDLSVQAKFILMKSFKELADEVSNLDGTLIFVLPYVNMAPFRSTISLEFSVRCVNGLSYQGERPLRTYTQKRWRMFNYDPNFMVKGPIDITTDDINRFYPKPIFTARWYNLTWMRSQVDILLMILCFAILLLALIPDSMLDPCLLSLRFILIVFLFGARACHFLLYLGANSEFVSDEFLLIFLTHFVILLDMLVYIPLSLTVSYDDVFGGPEARSVWGVFDSRWVEMEDLPPYVPNQEHSQERIQENSQEQSQETESSV